MHPNDSIPKGLCQCGCGQLAPIAKQTLRRYGNVKGQPKRFIAGHQHKNSGPDYVVEDRGYKTPCWIWQKSKTSRGYGIKSVATGKNAVAHAWYYEQKFGPIPSGLEPDHLCRVRACVNPDHIEPVTHRENILRSNAPGVVLHLSGLCKRGHAMTDDNVIVRPNGTRRCRTCSNDQQRARRHAQKVSR